MSSADEDKSTQRCLVCRQPVAMGDGAIRCCAMRGHTLDVVGHLCKVCKDLVDSDAENQDEDDWPAVWAALERKRRRCGKGGRGR